jgi:hypothetical protein
MILLSLKRSTSGNAAVKNPLALSATSFSSGGHVCYLGRVAQGVVHLLLEFENGEYNVKMNLKCFSLKQNVFRYNSLCSVYRCRFVYVPYGPPDSGVHSGFVCYVFLYNETGFEITGIGRPPPYRDH